MHIRLKDLISTAGIRLIEMSLKGTSGVTIYFVRLGEVGLHYDPLQITEAALTALFAELGFDTLRDPDDILVERIRVAAVELIYYANNANSLIRNSDFISEKLEMPYDKISRVFSKKTGRTIETYITRLKIEKSKQLISTGAYTLSEISYMLGYSSVQYLSNQFKKVTGITVSQYKEQPGRGWTPLEEL